MNKTIADSRHTPGSIAASHGALYALATSVVLSFALVGCGAANAGRSTTPEQIANAANTEAEGSTMEPTDLVVRDTRTGEMISFETMLDRMLEARVVYFGEHHDDAEHHALQQRIFAALVARDPSTALGLEMFQLPYQAPIDAYLRGDIDEAAMLEQTEYETRWGYDFAFFRPMFELARERGLQIVALNALRETTRQVGREGIDALPEDVREALPELNLLDAEHREMIVAAFGGHEAMEPAKLERYYTAQVIWDETMGCTVAQTMTAEGAPNRMFVIAGRMHVERGLGIPNRAGRRGATPFVTFVVAREGEVARPADFVWVGANE